MFGLRFFLLLVFFHLSLLGYAFAECSFSTAEYREGLRNPSSIEGIDITISKSNKWNKNLFKIVTTSKDFIDKKHKDNFRAKIITRYSFGDCHAEARVRINGDWKDHVVMSKRGDVNASLDVKLYDGNIISAVRFKLLLPRTRGFSNEIISTLFLRRMGFIAPRTFYVNIKVNGVGYLALFQEKSAKELLENSNRREGAIFEGDEELLWSYRDYPSLRLNAISGVRLVNDNWARGGLVSTLIAMNSFLELQHNYFDHRASSFASDRKVSYFNPNIGKKTKDVFSSFHAFLIAMNGDHALVGHNRKFYYNAIGNYFEPIYYDGNTMPFEDIKKDFHSSKDEWYFTDIDRRYYMDEFSERLISNLSASVRGLDVSDFSQEYSEHASLSFAESHKEVLKFKVNLLKNLSRLRKDSKVKGKELTLKDKALIYERLLSNGERLNFEQKYFILKAENFEDDTFVLSCVDKKDCEDINIDLPGLIDLMERNKINKERSILFDSAIKQDRDSMTTSTAIGDVLHSTSAKVLYNKQSSSLELLQVKPNDWFLIKDIDLVDVSINLSGMVEKRVKEASAQNFNLHGLTGCLNFINVDFKNVNIKAANGGCEDSVNIIDSRGDIASIDVRNAYSDAIDLDFSHIELAKVEVDSAANDCLDVSYGEYFVGEFFANGCGDKGLSVGESSTFDGQRITVSDSDIALSSKDFSYLVVKEFVGKYVNVCAEAFQKKQEFGGGELVIKSYDCFGNINYDKNSIIKIAR